MMATIDDLPSHVTRHRVLDTAEAAAFCRFSVPHWRRLYRSGDAPAPVRLSTRKYGWRIGDLIDWIGANRAEATIAHVRGRGHPGSQSRPLTARKGKYQETSSSE